MSDRFVLVALQPGMKMIEAGERQILDFPGDWRRMYPATHALNAYKAMCAASPVAADDPAMVKRVAIEWAESEGITWRERSDYQRQCLLKSVATVLRLFSPPKE